MSRIHRAYRSIATLMTITVVLLAVSSCGEDLDERNPGGGAVTVTVTPMPSSTSTSAGDVPVPIPTESHAAGETATAMYLASIPVAPPTSEPTVTPGGIPHGYDGIIIEGTVSITGAVTLETAFRYPAYGGQTTASCATFVEGVSRDWAQQETEAIFYTMDRYLLLPSPHDPAYVWDLSNTPEAIGRIWTAVRIMPYTGPGTYDGSSGVFGRSQEKEIPPGQAVPAIAFFPLPRIEIDGIAFSTLADDSAIQATIAVDGSGTLTFSNLHVENTTSSSSISGEMRWSCTNANGG